MNIPSVKRHEVLDIVTSGQLARVYLLVFNLWLHSFDPCFPFLANRIARYLPS